MFWLGALLTCAFATIILGVATQAVWIRRHFRRPLFVVTVTLAVSVVSVPVGLSIAVSEPGAASRWTPYAAGALMLALLGTTGFFLYMRHARIADAHVRRVLVVGAHPDDLELACGGSLARFADEGHQVVAIVMSHGGRGGDGDSRKQEALDGAESLDLAGISVQDFTDTRMATEIDEMVKVIELAVDLFKPDLILTHSAHDQHQDHHAVHLATMRAGRRSPTILCFESPSVTSDFSPSYFVDISDYLDAKIAAVERHKDQAGKPYVGAKVLRGAAVFRGGQARTAHAEGFEVIRALSSGVGDL